MRGFGVKRSWISDLKFRKDQSDGAGGRPLLVSTLGSAYKFTPPTFLQSNIRLWAAEAQIVWRTPPLTLAYLMIEP